MLARRLQPELMDDPRLDASEHRRALRGLARINRISGAGRSIWRPISTMLQRRAGDSASFSLLDIASGSGDVLLDVARRATRAGFRCEATACDISAEALGAVRDRFNAGGMASETLCRDVVARGLPMADRSIDVVTCSLFLHHLDADAATAVLREMARVARIGVVVSDLRRCRRGLIAAAVAGRVLTRSPVVRVDAVRSVYNAYSLAELREMAARAGMSGATVTRAWPFRALVRWERA
ncbi:MAG: methyltransferase domain-containing protein [Phycisphaerales bacterium]|nr:methyltransferase domain-containing protein [Phycisphaerales bacterium]